MDGVHASWTETEPGYKEILSALRVVMEASEPSYGVIVSDPQRNYFIQFLSKEDNGFFLCEAASDAFLADEHKLGEPQEKALRGALFQEPSEEMPNWWRTYRADGDALGNIAFFLLHLLRGAYGYTGSELDVTIGKRDLPSD